MTRGNADGNRQVVVITGAGGGIGSAIAKTFAEQDDIYDFILCDVAAGPLDELQESLLLLKVSPGRRSITTVTGDVTEPAFPSKIMTALANRKIDVLVAAHGVSPVVGNGPRILDINYTSCQQLVESVQHQHLMQAGSGVIILIGSMSAYFNANPLVDWGVRAWVQGGSSLLVWLLSRVPNTAYLVSKRCVQLYAQRKAAELRALAGVRILSVSPGMTATAMGRDMSQPWILDRFLGPMGRMATPQEVAAVVAFFASPVASYCSGMDVLVDGGVVASQTFPFSKGGHRKED